MNINSFDRRSFVGILIKEILDKSIALMALVVAFPILIVAALGIKISSPGPIFYKARRAGKGGKIFTMLKLRTMHVGTDHFSVITAPCDNRVFAFGFWLRRVKIDEILQFWNVLTGDMSLVGPRPEDPVIVERYYKVWMRETLLVLPGLTGPGTVYGYIYGDSLLDQSDPEISYAHNLLPQKLALERAYIERANLFGDIGYIILTAIAIPAHLLRYNVSLPRVDIDVARRWAPIIPYPSSRR